MKRASRITSWTIGGICAAVLPAAAARAQTIDELQQMTIDQLGTINVSSVAKTAQPLNEAPAAVYLITHDDIVRSGRMTLPEILRLAPNLEVYQTAAGQYVITARGMNGNAADQSYANKLLVMIDGRSVFSPLFSGVYWDMQDVLPQDIERIEVISGPGAALWGANAVNGVVNIITRSAADTAGGLVDAQLGGRSRAGAVRFGDAVSDTLAWRAYIRGVRDYNDAIVDGRLAGAKGDAIIDILTRYSTIKDPAIHRAVTAPYIDPDGKLNVDSLAEDLSIFASEGLIEGKVDMAKAVDTSFIEAAVKELGPYRAK